jgi:hypothetical protein
MNLEKVPVLRSVANGRRTYIHDEDASGPLNCDHNIEFVSS